LCDLIFAWFKIEIRDCDYYLKQESNNIN